MQLRRLLLLALIVSLAISAIAGVLAAFSSSYDFFPRVIGTAVDAAVCLALMFAYSFALARPKTRDSGIASMVLIVGAFLAFISVIWGDLLISRASDGAFGIAFAWLLCGFPVTLLLLDKLPHHRLAIWTSILLLFLSFCLATLGFFLNDYSTSDRAIATAFILPLYGLGVVINLIPAKYRFQFPFRIFGSICAILALYLALVACWGDSIDSIHFRQLLFTATGIALTITITHLVALLPLVGWQALARFFTLAVSVGCIALIDFVVCTNSHLDLFDRLIAATAIVASCSLLSLFIMAFLNRRTHFDTLDPARTLIDIDLTCPRCSKKQTLKLNGAECSACQLRIDIRIEEPRCPNCSYLLFMLTNNRCPECGTEIAPTPIPTT